MSNNLQTTHVRILLDMRLHNHVETLMPLQQCGPKTTGMRTIGFCGSMDPTIPYMDSKSSMISRASITTLCFHMLSRRYQIPITLWDLGVIGKLLGDGALPDTTGSRHRTLPAHVSVAVITRRSAHCSLLRTHKPGSPLLPCSARALMPLRRFLNPLLDCSI